MVPSDGDVVPSPSCSRIIARREPGTRSPLFKLPLLYVVRVDRLRVWPGGFGGRIGMSSDAGTSESNDERAASMLIRRTILAGSLTSSSRSCRLTSMGSSIFSLVDLFLSSRSAPSSYPAPSSTCLESIDFLRLRLPPPEDPTESESPLSDDLFMVLTLSWMNVLNSFGASSGCKRAGTQNNLDGSSSSASADGATGGTPKLEPKLGRSGSMELTSIDMRLIACRLLNS